MDIPKSDFEERFRFLAARNVRFLRRWWPALAAVAVIIPVAVVVGLLGLIESSANSYAAAAQREFPGDKVEALVQYVQSDRHTLQARNHAVWALGQLRDRRGLPVLLKYYTGGQCDHGRRLCQSELKKAVDLCSGKTSGPAWLRWVRTGVRQAFGTGHN